jgi:hypothetical protein
MSMAIKFYEKKEFRRLKAEWEERLEKAEFDDIEKKEKFCRPQYFKADGPNTLDFFLALDHYLTDSILPKRHRRVLALYSAGLKAIEIAKKTNTSYSHTRRIIEQYTKVVMSTF